MNLVYAAIAMAAFGTACLIACAYGLWRISRDEKRRQRPGNWDIDPNELAQHIAKWTDDIRREDQQ